MSLISAGSISLDSTFKCAYYFVLYLWIPGYFVCYCSVYASQLIKSFPISSLVCLYGFYHASSHHFSPSIKSTLILTIRIKIIIKLQIYITTLLYIPFTTHAHSNGKLCITASELMKESEKHIFYCKTSWFGFYVLFILWCVWKLYGPEKYFGRSHI